MKKSILLFLFLLTVVGNNAKISAQSSAVKKSAQSVFTLTTFKADGSLLASTHGVFVDKNGYAISSWKSFVGASSAVVIDAQGKKHNVDAVVGCNDIYDVCKFHVDGTTTPAPVSTTPETKGKNLWLACYGLKDPKLLHAAIKDVESFMEKYSFYILNITMPEDADFCPLINDNGQVVALTQPTSAKDVANGVDAAFVSTFYTTSLSMANQTLKKTLIPTELPSSEKDAQLALILARQNFDRKTYSAVIERFIAKFPTLPDGYLARAINETEDKNFSAAAQDMEKAISVATNKAEAHYSYSDLILSKLVSMPDDAYADWTYDKALDEARKAQSISDMPVYKNQEGRVLFAQKKYDEAYNVFMSLQDTNMKGPETLEEALQCKQQSGADFSDLMVLMDSIVASCPHPLTYQSGAYLLQRAVMYHQHGNYRKAMQEYYDYEKLMVGHKLSADFYFNRFTCERDGKIFQQALDDIDKAITLNPNSPMYYCEKGSLLLRVGKYQDAVDAANKALTLNNSYADAYAILGTGQCLLGKKYEGLLNLDEAKRKGYENADALIQKYK